MSLKARFRIAIVALTFLVVGALSALYAYQFLNDWFQRSSIVAESITYSVGTVVADRLRNDGNLDTLSSDEDLRKTMMQILSAWHQVDEIYITAPDGRLILSTTGGPEVQRAPAMQLKDWASQGLISKVRFVLAQDKNLEHTFTMARARSNDAIATVHVSISSFLLGQIIIPQLVLLAWIFGGSLLVSIAAALLLPWVVLNPLERLGHRIEQMAIGQPEQPPAPRREPKEFADVHAKLNLLGQRVEGARRDVTAMKGNVARMLEQLQEAVLLFDTSGRLVMAGEPARRYLGYDPEQAIGRTAEEVFPPSSALGRLIEQAVRNGEPIRDRIIDLNVGGIQQRVIASVEPLSRISPSDQELGIFVALRDADTSRQIEEQLDIADRLTALGQLTRGVAHEIKNPLNAITLHLEVLKSRLGPDEAPEAEVIGNEIARLNRIVKTFLDFHRPVDLRITRLDLNQLVAEVARFVEPDGASRDVEVQCHPCPAPIWVDADRDLLKQAILNVVANAIEATPDGGGRVDMACGRMDGCARVQIMDNGPGIRPEILDKVFNLYFTTKQHGSGIGLALSYRFVQLLNGRITVESQPGQGAAFTIELPEAASEPSSEPPLFSRSHRA